MNRLIAQHAPHLPTTRLSESRPPATEEEWQHFYPYRIAGAAHDLFIVQLCARAIDNLFPDDPEMQFVLSRQLGDDGAHALDTRQRVRKLSGHDPIMAIQRQSQQHWDYLGEAPTRNWVGFIAWELHYELHIVAILLLTSRLGRINEPGSARFAAERILPDEFVHRAGIVAWWQRKYDQAPPRQKKDLAARLLDLDEEIQWRRNAYLRNFWQQAQRALGFAMEGFEVLYDAWRREVLAYLLDIPASQLPPLISINDCIKRSTGPWYVGSLLRSCSPTGGRYQEKQGKQSRRCWQWLA